MPSEYLGRLEDLPYRTVEDLYIEGTLLRLRKMTDLSGAVVYKLCKKYGRGDSLANPITNIYLSEREYLSLAALLGSRVCKRRYGVAGGSIDVYPGADAVAIFEMDFRSESEAASYVPPDFVGDEVTDCAQYSGAVLASSRRFDTE
ncbi:hypothetical protein GCM10007863_26730 [Dyella mobilis]|nr:hypothetical protein GCM10007863_26730 [Dyella mobilis]